MKKQLKPSTTILGCIKSSIKTNYGSLTIVLCYPDESACLSGEAKPTLICLPEVKATTKGEFKIPLPEKTIKQLPASLVFKVFQHKKLLRTFSESSFADCIKAGREIVLVLQPFDLTDTLEIKGKVTDKEGVGLGGLRIIPKGGLEEELVVLSRESGAFFLTLPKDMFEDPSEVAPLHFQVFKGKKLIKTQVGTTSWDPNNPGKSVKIVIDHFDLETIHTVTGTLTYANRKPAAKITVKLFDQDFRIITPLGETTTDDTGKYKLNYQGSQLKKGKAGKENKAADLFIRAVGPDTTNAYEESASYHKAGIKTVIDLKLSAVIFPVKAEFEEIYECIAPFLKIHKLRHEDLDTKDLDYLAGEIQYEKQALQLFHLSFLLVTALTKEELRAAREISAKAPRILFPLEQFFYGILRQNNPKELMGAGPQEALDYTLELTENRLRKNFYGASQNFFVQKDLEKLLTPLVEKVWHPSQLHKMLRTRRTHSGITTGFLLESIGVKDAKLALPYIELLGKYGGENPLFFEALAKSKILSIAQIKSLQFKVELEEASYGNPEFAAFLLRELGINSPEELAKLTKEALAKKLRRANISLPKNFPGETQEEKLCALLCLLEFYFPEAFIREGSLTTLPGTKEMKAADRDKLKGDIEILLGNNPDFKITEGLHQQDKRAKNGKRGLNTEGIKRDFDTITLPYLEKLNRLFRITERESEMSTLLEDGLDSANKIFLRGQQTFVHTYQDKFGEGRAQDIYNNAVAITQTALGVYMGQLDPGLATVNPPKPTLENEFPAWEKLFGSISSCACADCESVLSPSAYLVSLFEFLDSADCFERTAGQKNALELLFDHRPDLPCIHLNCENTNTEVPYLDIVNELMEEYVKSSTKGWDKQTTRSKKELAVMPEHINRGAYTKIYNSHNLRKLPYHLELDECRTYLNGLGIDRLLLTEKFLPLLTQKEVLHSADWAIEKLAINKKEFELFEEGNTTLVATLWGEDLSASWYTSLLQLRGFLKKTGLNSREAYTLFDLHFIKDQGGFKIQSVNKGKANYSPEDDCDLDLLEIKGKSSSNVDSLFKRIYFVLRLKEITGWSFYELDEYLIWRNGKIDLQEIAQLITLMDQLKCGAYQVLSLYAPFSNTAYTDYSSDRIKAVPSFMDRVFRLLDSNGQLLTADFNQTIKNQAGLIASGCNLTAEELKDIVTARGQSIQWTHNLSLNSLSYFYRIGVLIRSLNISLGEYSNYLHMLGYDPLVIYHDPNNTATVVNTLEFIRSVNLVRSLKFSKEELYFVLKGEPAQMDTGQERDIDVKRFFAQTIPLVDHIYVEEFAAGDLDEQLLTEELASLLGVNLSEDIAGPLTNLILDPTASHLALVDDHPWFKYTHEDTALFRRHFVNNAASNPDFLKLPAKRYKYIVGQLIYWNKTVEVLEKDLSAEFNIDPRNSRQLLIHNFFQDAANSLLHKTIKIRQDQDSAYTELRDNYLAFKKASKVIGHLKLSGDVLEFILSFPVGVGDRTHGKLLDCYDLAACIADKNYESNLAQLEKLYQVQNLYNTNHRQDSTILNVLEILLQQGAPNIRQDFYAAYKSLLGWNQADLNYLIGVEGATANWGAFGFDIQLPLPYLDPAIPQADTGLLIPLLSRLYEIRVFAHKHPYPVEQFQRWISNETNPLKEAAKQAYTAFKHKSNNSTWHQKAASLRNDLREKQRDALVVYLLNKWDMAAPEELYTKLLVDVEMNSCRNTSRIKSAISSTQLYINRILMNLEASIQPLEKAGKKWKWMKMYRIWEAKQKVFFFPENYIVPSLLDTKTSLLENLENDLLKNELDEVSAKEAVITYLEEFGKIARLQICGVYEEKMNTGQIYSKMKQPQEKTLHVFARTWSKPHEYYYRKQDSCGVWTAWEKVDADLEGAQLIPIVYNNRMYVFWPEITQEVDDMGEVLMNSMVSGIGQGIQGAATAVSHLMDLALTSITIGPAYIIDATRRVLWTIKRSVPGIAAFNDFVDKIDSYAEKLKEFKTTVSHTPMWQDNIFDLAGVFDFQEAIDKALKAVYDLLPKKRWNIKLAWCEKTQGKWSAKKIADASLEYEDAIGALFGGDNKSFVFNGRVRTENGLNKIEINCNINSPTVDLDEDNVLRYPYVVDLKNREIGKFSLENRLSPLRAIQIEEVFDGFEVLQNLAGDAMAGIRAEANKLNALGSGHPVSESDQEGNIVRDEFDDFIPESYNDSFGFYDTILGTDQPQFWYQLITPHQYPLPLNSNNGYSHPFFYQDARNTYFVNANNLRNNALNDSLEIFKHPFVSDFVSRLDSLNLDGFYSLTTQQLQNAGDSIVRLLPEEVTFDLKASHAQYNWELFFHTPFIISDKLRQNQKYEQALKWLNFIFDPTISQSVSSVAGPTAGSKYWLTKPFFETTTEAYQEARLKNILGLDNENGDATAKHELECLMDKLVEDPFNVHLIARYRTTAYQKAIVMLYADILIEWGDHLFRQYTIETITEAFGHYYTALTLLGSRPEILPPKTRVNRAYKEKQSTAESNHLELMESMLTTRGRSSEAHAKRGMTKAEVFRFSNCLPAKTDTEDITDPEKDQQAEIIRSLSIGYFCLPYNKKLHGYWDTLEDRMFKIRNCLNIKGELQSLSLFQPEIDPALLVKIAAQGGSIAEAAGFLNMPPGHYRFQYVLQKAFELCGELKSLGAALLSSIEKGDGEALSLLRNTHEQKMLDRVSEIKEIQLDEASLTIASLEKQVESTQRRKQFYEANLAMPLNLFESAQLGLTATSIIFQSISSSTKLAAAISFLIPEIKGGFVTTLGVSTGGKNTGNAVKEGAESLGTLASILNSIGSMIGTMGSYERRMQDWVLQKDVLDIELQNMDIQIESASRRLEIAQKELDNQNLLKEQTREIRDYMEDKFSNVELYNWQVNEISKIFFRTYQLTFDLALQAEKAYQLEMGVESSNYVQYGRWDSLKKGLLSGEKLFADLKELEIAYMQRNTRTPELSKTVSLKMLSPIALLELKTTGACSFSIPEYIFDLDHPGHYFRRIKSVSLSMPCIVGPYTGVNTKLSLESHETRKDIKMVGANNDDYVKDPTGVDDRFISNSIGVNTIATSSSQNDNGMFEFNLRDERYLPFEGAGVISSWKLELPPPQFKQFDYNSISDVLLHLNYTARDGGEEFRDKASESIGHIFNNFISNPPTDTDNPMTRLFSLRHDFPNEWQKFKSTGADFEAILKKEHFNYITQGRNFDRIQLEIWSIDKDSELKHLENLLKPDNNAIQALTDDLNDASKSHTAKIKLDGTKIGSEDTPFIMVSYALI